MAAPCTDDAATTPAIGRTPASDDKGLNRWPLRTADDLTVDKQAIVKRARPYALRHTYATFLLRQTKNLQTTKELMRHGSDNTTKRYTRGRAGALTIAC